jgi:hypothetical protein
VNDDWSQFLAGAAAKSSHQLEVEAEAPDHLGGNAQIRAIARAEIKRRDREAIEKLALQQLAVAEQQAKSAKSAIRAAWGSAVAALLACVVSLWQAYHTH